MSLAVTDYTAPREIRGWRVEMEPITAADKEIYDLAYQAAFEAAMNGPEPDGVWFVDAAIDAGIQAGRDAVAAAHTAC